MLHIFRIHGFPQAAANSSRPSDVSELLSGELARDVVLCGEQMQATGCNKTYIAAFPDNH